MTGISEAPHPCTASRIFVGSWSRYRHLLLLSHLGCCGRTLFGSLLSRFLSRFLDGSLCSRFLGDLLGNFFVAGLLAAFFAAGLAFALAFTGVFFASFFLFFAIDFLLSHPLDVDAASN